MCFSTFLENKSSQPYRVGCPVCRETFIKREIKDSSAFSRLRRSTSRPECPLKRMEPPTLKQKGSVHLFKGGERLEAGPLDCLPQKVKYPSRCQSSEGEAGPPGGRVWPWGLWRGARNPFSTGVKCALFIVRDKMDQWDLRCG